MTALCVGRDPEWWTPQSEQARLALRICALCTGCPDDDPTPHGVIRQGVPYSDTGTVIPLCPNCARPSDNYRGGFLVNCTRCAAPNLPLPSVKWSRRRWIVALHRRGLSDAVIAAEAEATVPVVVNIRHRYARKNQPSTPKERTAA